MAKKQSALSQPAKLTDVSAESIWSKPLAERQKSTLDRIARKHREDDDSQIDDSDIPQFTHEQLAEFRRPAKKLIAVRLDADVFEWLQKFGPGYSTRINHVLRTVMTQGRSLGFGSLG